MQTQGFSIIELIVFIVVMGIIATVILIPLGTMLQNSGQNDQGTVAMMLANRQMEWWQGQRAQLGYAAIATGALTCTQAICTFIPIPTGYTVTTNVASGFSSSTNYKQITVTVTGANVSLGNATVNALIANY